MLSIKRLQVETLIGTHAWEQRQKQRLYINIDCALDILKAAANDQLEDTLDYQQLATELIALLEHSHFQLIESVARCVADYLRTQHGIIQGKVEIIKPGALAQAESVGVVLAW